VQEKDFIHLLVEIRDLQREHLEEYRRVTKESLEVQRRSFQGQERIGRLYRRVVAVAALVVAAFVVFLVWLYGGFG
jgi:hypothetical protein